MIFTANLLKGKIKFEDKLEVIKFLNSLGACKIDVSIAKAHKKRTASQNNAIHLYFELLADALNESGQDMRKVLKESVEIDWNGENIKEYLWRPVMYQLTKKKSTTQLNTNEINEIYETLNRYLAKFGVQVEFPRREIIDGLDT